MADSRSLVRDDQLARPLLIITQPRVTRRALMINGRVVPSSRSSRYVPALARLGLPGTRVRLLTACPRERGYSRISERRPDRAACASWRPSSQGYDQQW